jgi:hypothetical protein
MGETLTFNPTDIFIGDLADKLGIPVKYLRKLQEKRPDLFDANVNGWLHGTLYDFGRVMREGSVPDSRFTPDNRTFTLRTFHEAGSDEPGIARSLQSDRYAIIDHLDVIFAAMAGIEASGEEVVMTDSDLSERRMSVKFAAPGLSVYAPALLTGYNVPENVARWRRIAEREHQGFVPGEEPIVFAGFEVNNSEVGQGGVTIVPRMMVNICGNGLVIPVDVFRKIHLGGANEAGLIQFSGETRAKMVELITLEARDVVKTFLSKEYVEETIAYLEALSGKEVTDAPKTVELIGKALAFTEEEQQAILNAFIDGGQRNAGGILQAITGVAQVVDSPDRAYELEHNAVAAMAMAV